MQKIRIINTIYALALLLYILIFKFIDKDARWVNPEIWYILLCFIFAAFIINIISIAIHKKRNTPNKSIPAWLKILYGFQLGIGFLYVVYCSFTNFEMTNLTRSILLILLLSGYVISTQFKAIEKKEA